MFDHEKMKYYNMNDVTVLPKKKFSPVPITSGLGPERAILERIVQNQKSFTHKNSPLLIATPLLDIVIVLMIIIVF